IFLGPGRADNDLFGPIGFHTFNMEYIKSQINDYNIDNTMITMQIDVMNENNSLIIKLHQKFAYKYLSGLRKEQRKLQKNKKEEKEGGEKKKKRKRQSSISEDLLLLSEESTTSKVVKKKRKITKDDKKKKPEEEKEEQQNLCKLLETSKDDISEDLLA